MALPEASPSAVDDRLTIGAYVSKGISLYRVEMRGLHAVTLMDAYTDKIVTERPGDIIANYTLARAAEAKA